MTHRDRQAAPPPSAADRTVRAADRWDVLFDALPPAVRQTLLDKAATCPLTADELPPGAAGLAIQSRLNGQVMQSANTRDMLVPVAETVALLTDRDRWTATRDALRDVRTKLGKPGASGRAADAVLEVATRDL